MPDHRIAVAGGGIYGATIAIELADAGHRVTLYDPLGILNGASAINQFRIHNGYHYPRSRETIAEVVEARAGFLEAFGAAVVPGVTCHYAIPHEGSRTAPDAFEAIMGEFDLPLERVRPDWMNFDVIDRCYRVEESLYDPNALRALLTERLRARGIDCVAEALTEKARERFDFTVYATYGASGSHMRLFDAIKVQVVEKIRIRLPDPLPKQSLVVIDGPFTAFDPYGDSDFSQFGSALHTNHWASGDPEEPIPERYRPLMNLPEFREVAFSNFEKMRAEAAAVVPLCAEAEYAGSRFTRRLVEDAPATDRRIMRIGTGEDERTLHVFSGKVVGAVIAARTVAERIGDV